jgi:osmotically-inducible protein OsmY
MRKIGPTLTALTALVLFVACSSSVSRDAAISRRIKTRLDVDPIVDSSAILVSTRQGVVTLEGEVDSPAALRRCLEVASMDPEVSRVIDRIRMTRPARVDERPPIQVQARVRARGERDEPKPAAEPADRPDARRAASTPAVIPSGDGEIDLEAVAATSRVRSGSPAPAALEAAAASPAPEQAVEDGALPVDDDALPAPEAGWWTDSTASAEDAAITLRVRSRIEESVPGGHILIVTRRGVVTLSGIVHSQEDRTRAIRSARGTQGVERVEDRLIVAWS